MGSLVLSRKLNESITLLHPAGDVRIVTIEAHRGKARLAFDAPRSIKIYRQEVLEMIHTSKAVTLPSVVRRPSELIRRVVEAQIRMMPPQLRFAASDADLADYEAALADFVAEVVAEMDEE